MNALEKVQLIKELQKIGHDLDHRKLSLFEVARSKKRVHDIFELCDEPIFKKQQRAYKSKTQPDVAAYEFASETPYNFSFRGYFLDEYALEDALYEYPESGWAFLHHPKQGWQIWLIPAPHRTALISEWTHLEQSFEWLVEQQELSACLKTDDYLRAQAMQLSLDDVISDQSKAKISLPPTSAELLSTPPLKRSTDEEASLKLSPIQALKAILPTTSTQQKPESVENKIIDVPHEIQLGTLTALVQSNEQEQLSEHMLFRLELAHLPESQQYLDIILHHEPKQDWQQKPIFLAEEKSRKGKFKCYLMLLGAENLSQAHKYLSLWSQDRRRHVVAIKSIPWAQLNMHFTDFSQLFESYQRDAEIQWCEDDYLPCIPLQSINTQRFIFFEEAPADYSTPLLLLQERGKIRLIHGSERLALSSSELACPYVLYQRSPQLNWQILNQLVQELPKPVEAQALHERIQQHLAE